MATRDTDRFKVKPGAPKGGAAERNEQRSQHFVSLVLKQVSKAGANVSGAHGARPTSTFGRGRVAASRTGHTMKRTARRVVVKSRYLVLKKAGAKSVSTHLRYIERDGVTRDGKRGRAYGAETDTADLKAFEKRGKADRHQFRFIVSVEDAGELEDLRGYTRELMRRMTTDLETRLDWVAVDHWDTDNPHTHIVLRGRDQTGQDLIIARDYVAHGMRLRACDLATEWLGPRTEREIREGLLREVEQERWTSLDRSLQQQARQLRDGVVDLGASIDAARHPRTLLIGRLQRLTDMGLAESDGINRWRLRPDIEPTLRAMGERGDIVRSMQRALKSEQREMTVITPGEAAQPVVGRVIGKGLTDELQQCGYLVLDGIDGCAHYIVLPGDAQLEQFPVGAVVEARGAAEWRAVDKTIAGLAERGLYRTDHHLALLLAQPSRGGDPQETVAGQVRRLEALRRAGLVERVTESTWRVPMDLPERARQHDAQRSVGGSVTLHSHQPIERQTRVVGATWLDRQLIGGATGVADKGFGSELRKALRQRSDFLIEQGLAERHGARLVLARNLLATLRQRDLSAAASGIANETAMQYRPAMDGDRVFGVYRRNILLASGRFAMIDDGLGFTLVPWKPVIEQRIGQRMAAIVRGGGVTWELGRNIGLTI
jgi:type IV secretory pathway VirD2 relaxase